MDFGQKENSSYLQEQLITYIGNKRALLGCIEDATQHVCEDLGKPKLEIFDGFSGSGVVSRLFKRYASRLVTCDLENYARIISECFLANRNEVPLNELSVLVNQMNTEADSTPSLSLCDKGFFQRLYAPNNDSKIEVGERAFYTTDNAYRLDYFRQRISLVPVELQPFLLGPLLSEASIHVNTAGIFKGFYKQNGVGRFGGGGENALQRIKGKIHVRTPVLSNYECEYKICIGDTNQEVQSIGSIDLAYFDPPYNQHPYGSNYFMLNLLVDYKEPKHISTVSGIPVDWNRSDYNVKKKAFGQFKNLLENTDAKFLLVSFNDEGFISPCDMRGLLSTFGELQEVEVPYNAFRGSRNLSNRTTHVTEHLFLVKKK